MAIQHRRGVYNKFDSTKLLPGEWAVVLSGDSNSSDGKAVYVCFAAGSVKRMATFEDMVANIANAEEDIVTALAASASELEAAIEAAEALRVTAEEGRVSAESLRVSAESDRASAESARASAETARDQAENGVNGVGGRVNAEAARVAAETARETRFAELEQYAEGWLVYHCESGEYDSVTGKPSITAPDAGTIYCVPTGDSSNPWMEWRYDTVDQDYEPLGNTATTTPITTSAIDSIVGDTSLSGTEVLQTTGLTYLWTKLKAAFSSLTHTHSAQDITSGTLAVTRGGTGQSSLASSRAKLGSIPMGTCDTATSTYTKVVTLADFTLFNGARISVKFDNKMDVYANTLKLNVNSTGAIDVYAGGAVNSSSNKVTWSAGAICEFVYDGSHWNYLGNNVDGYEDYQSGQSVENLKTWTGANLADYQNSSKGSIQHQVDTLRDSVSDYVISQYYWQQADTTNGNRTYTHNVPSGYKFLSVGYVFATGDSSARTADVSVTDNGASITITIYTHNPEYKNVGVCYYITYVRNV